MQSTRVDIDLPVGVGENADKLEPSALKKGQTPAHGFLGAARECEDSLPSSVEPWFRDAHPTSLQPKTVNKLISSVFY